MKLLKSGAVSVLLLLFSVALMPSAQAQSTFHRTTHVTFSGPVQIGAKTLPAGEYVMQLEVLPGNETNIVEIRDKTGENHIATFLTIPDYRITPTGKTVIMFRERAANAPQALRAWFYPGENFGHEFVYPMRVAKQLAQANHVDVPAVADNTAENDLKGSHVTEATPNGGEAEVAQSNPPAETQNLAPVAADPAPSNQSNNLVASNQPLPKTASSLYLIALSGGLCLAVAFALSLVTRQRGASETRL